MPLLKPCCHPGCHATIPNPGPSRCPKHTEQARLEKAARDRSRASPAKQGYDLRWRVYRASAFCGATRSAAPVSARGA